MTMRSRKELEVMNVIKTEGLTKYYGTQKGIEHLNLEVYEGEVFGFIGPNGAGKSTTIRTLLGFIKPTYGTGTILGHNIRSNLKEAKRDIGYLPSEVTYYDDMTSLQLLKYSSTFYGGGLDKRILELADYFELNLKRKIEDLSYGNRKKLGIIQSILHNPKLLIMDEPTGGLDPLMQNRFFELIQKEKTKGTTVFFSSHVLSEVQRLCNRVGIIKDGKIVKIDEIKSLSEVNYKKIRIAFKSEEDFNKPHQFDIEDYRVEDGIAKFIYGGDIKELLRYVTTNSMSNIWIEDPSLEEIFIHHYKE